MSSSFIHHSGALLLEKGDLAQLDGDLRPTARDVAVAIDHAGGLGDEAMADAHDDDDGDDAGAMDFDMPFGDADAAPIDGPGERPRHEGATPAADGGGADGAEGAEGEEEEEEDDFDPYAALDPYDASGMQAKPFKRGSTRLARRAQDERAGALSLGPKDLGDWQRCFPAACAANAAAFGEFAYAFEEMGRAERRAQRRARDAGAQMRGMHQRSVFAEAEEDAVGKELEDAGFVDGDDDFPGGGADDDGDFDLPNDTIDFEMPRPMEDLDAGDPEVSYEALCRQHIDKIIAAAAAEEVRSELAQRVSVWQSKIDPMLKDADSRPPFDIRVYKTGILHTYAPHRAPRIGAVACPLGAPLTAASRRRTRAPPARRPGSRRRSARRRAATPARPPPPASTRPSPSGRSSTARRGTRCAGSSPRRCS